VLLTFDIAPDRIRRLLLRSQIHMDGGLVVQVIGDHCVDIAKVRRREAVRDLLGATARAEGGHHDIQANPGAADLDGAVRVRL